MIIINEVFPSLLKKLTGESSDQLSLSSFSHHVLFNFFDKFEMVQKKLKLNWRTVR